VACGTGASGRADVRWVRIDQTWLVRSIRPGHDEAVPQTRSILPRRSQIISLLVIVAVGLTVGVLAGAWWGVGAAVIMLAISEVIERVQRSRT
jgi:F0F1-type ATP synthase beta subunit